ncbi:MAG: NUDIX domain-containing protein [Nocardioidaceae bacterium]
MAKRSSGILLYRPTDGGLQVLLVHPGGPLWARREERAWSIPKGGHDDGEDPRACALREFREETGTSLASEELIELGSVRQSGGKLVTAWAARGELDVDAVRSNTFTMEWPPRSGRTAEFPEIDRAAWFELDAAREKLVAAQVELLDRLLERLPPGDRR